MWPDELESAVCTAFGGEDVSEETCAFLCKRVGSGASSCNEAFGLRQPDFPLSAIGRRFDVRGASYPVGSESCEAKSIGMEMGDGAVAMDDEVELLGERHVSVSLFCR